MSTVAQEVTYLDMVIDETLRLYTPAPRYIRVLPAPISSEFHDGVLHTKIVFRYFDI